MFQEALLPFSFMLGVLHALEPGHGKTAMVAYMLSGKKNMGHALVMALGSAFSHTVVLFLIALLTHLAGHTFSQTGHGEAPMLAHTLEWIGALSILGIGVYLSYQAILSQRRGHPSSCQHGHREGQPFLCQGGAGDDTKRHSFSVRRQGYKVAALLGISGGLIPCPTAVAAYLSGVAKGETQSVFVMLFAFSLGVILAFLTVAALARHAGNKIKQSSKFKNMEKRWAYLRSTIILVIGFVYVAKLILN